MRAVIYARVSSATQRERDTIASQLKVLPEYVRAQGWELARPASTYVDDGRSARTGMLEHRDGFAKLVRDAAAGVFDVVVVVDINRLTRTEDFMERAMILAPFQRNNVRIATPTGGVLDLSTMLGEMMVMMKALVGAEESRVRVERTTRGKRAAAELGRKVSGRTPYGLHYSRETHVWTLDEPAAAAIRDAAARVLAGASCYSIALELNRRGVTRPSGGAWTRSRVWELLTSPHVAGVYVTDKKRRTKAAVPAILDQDTFDSVGRVLVARARTGRRPTNRIYMLTGIAVCAECGARIVVRSGVVERRRGWKTKTPWVRPAEYRCTAFCKSSRREVTDAEARVWNAICAQLDDPNLIARLEVAAENEAGDRGLWERDIATYRDHLARLDKKETSVLARFRRDAISEVALDDERASIKRERSAYRQQLAAAERALGAAGPKARLAQTGAFLDGLRARSTDGSLVERKAVIAALVDHGGIRVGPEITVSLWLPIVGSAVRTSGATNFDSTNATLGLRITLVT